MVWSVTEQQLQKNVSISDHGLMVGELSNRWLDLLDFVRAELLVDNLPDNYKEREKAPRRTSGNKWQRIV